jgi:hypothetical protein
MKQGLYQTNKDDAGKTYKHQLVAEKKAFYRTRASAYNSIDDFMKEVSTVNEYGDHVISGKRIC